MADAVLIDVATRVAPDVEVVLHRHRLPLPRDAGDGRRACAVATTSTCASSTPEVPLDDRWQTDTDGCCAARKVAPLEEALADKDAWLSGLRRADSADRADTPIVERDRRGLVKVNPLATWSDAEVDAYIAAHDVPINPLLAQGYPSVGCWPCTRAVAEGEDARAGRWAGSTKTECGLHL